MKSFLERINVFAKYILLFVAGSFISHSFSIVYDDVRFLVSHPQAAISETPAVFFALLGILFFISAIALIHEESKRKDGGKVL